MISNKPSYQDVYNELDKLEIGFKDRVVAVLFAILIPFLAISGPLAIIINFMIFIAYERLFVSLIGALIIIFVYLADRIYLKLISKGRVNNLNVVYITDTFIISLAVIGILNILFMIGVI